MKLNMSCLNFNHIGKEKVVFVNIKIRKGFLINKHILFIVLSRQQNIQVILVYVYVIFYDMPTTYILLYAYVCLEQKHTNLELLV